MPDVKEPRAGEVWVRTASDRGRPALIQKETRRVLAVERRPQVRGSKVTWLSGEDTTVSTLSAWRKWANKPTLWIRTPEHDLVSLWTRTNCVHTRAGRAWDPQQAVQLLLQLAEQGHTQAAEEVGFIAAHFDEYNPDAMDERLTKLSKLLRCPPLR